MSWASLRHARAFRLNPAPGIHSGTYLTIQREVNVNDMIQGHVVLGLTTGKEIDHECPWNGGFGCCRRGILDQTHEHIAVIFDGMPLSIAHE